MNKITQEQFQELLTHAQVRPKAQKELRFITSVSSFSDEDWQMSEVIPIYERSQNKGVLILSVTSDSYALLTFELKRGLISKSGSAQPIICDFCRTWQTGSRAGSIMFPQSRGKTSTGFLCCADLQCSKHVRSLTSAARTSRSQLREDLTDEQRVTRLRNRLNDIAIRLDATFYQLFR